MHSALDEKILKYINKFTLKNNYTPSYRDIAQALKISTSTAWCHIDDMKKKGIIKDLGTNKARALIVDSKIHLLKLEKEFQKNPTEYNKGRLDEARKILQSSN